ncbi:MAG: hypothetical protein PUC39_08315 [Lachnospiraceae bacterium]|nr:hypothetical protein [Lachnospiraceae bacterium]
MNNTMKRRVEIAKNMLEVEIPMEDIVEMSGLTLEEVKKLSKEVTVRVRDTEDVVNFDLKDTLYHYDDVAARVDETGHVVVERKEEEETDSESEN